MARIILFEDQQHSFPDDATDAEIAAALDDHAETAAAHVGINTKTPQDTLNLLKAQLADPGRDPASTAELQAAIQRVMKQIPGAASAAPVPNPGTNVPKTSTPPQQARPSQADVRASEPPHTLAAQNADEQGYDAALKAWVRNTQLGQYHAGPNAREQFSKITGRPDPLLNRDNAEVQHAAETGEVVYGTGLTYEAGKAAASLGGFMAAGPAGATGAELLVRSAALVNNLDRAVKAGAIDETRAAEILATELVKGTGIDAAWNFGLPVIGQLVKKLPGVTWLTTKAEDAIKNLMLRSGRTPAAPAKSLRDAKIDSRAGLTEDPARQQAVRDLSARTGDFIPTPGQVSGAASIAETTVNKAFPAQFEAQEKALKSAASDMLHETTAPASQPSAHALGQEIQTYADKTQEAVKKRLSPVFEEADKLKVKVDMADVKGMVKKALLEDSRVIGGKLQPQERAQLESILADFEKQGHTFTSAKYALDFISRRKEQLRATTADWKPSKEYDTVIGALTTAADTAYVRAAGNAGKSDVVKKLLDAQRDYKEMMGTVYDDAIKAALKKNPEDVGRFLWQGGNVSEPQQLQKMLKIAMREGAVSPQQARELSGSVVRGFMQEAVPTIEAAAKWSTTLKESPAKRRTWEELTSAPGGAELRQAMAVLEHAAQIATTRDTAASKKLFLGLAAGRAAQGGLGVSYVTGAIHPGMAVAGLTVAGTMKLMSTAYTHGDKGAINLITKVLRMRDAGTPAATQALRAALPDLEAAAEKYGVDDIFEPKE